jgi:DNA-binding CsgD family transcriptional regulator
MQLDLGGYSRSLAAIEACDAVAPLRQATMDALALFGITRGYFLAPLTKDARIGRIITNIGLPWQWERQYRAGLYLSDPLPDLAMARLAPIRWPEDLAGIKLDRKQQRYIDIAGKQGLGRGIGIACFGPDGRSGFLAAVLDDAAPPPDQLMLQRIQAVGQVAFQTYCRLIKMAQDVPQLSNRELEVLHWIGRGKSNSVIADILAISPSSVDVYVRRLFAKLGVSDRTTASIKAYALGLLVSADYEQFVKASRALQPGEGDLAL